MAGWPGLIRDRGLPPVRETVSPEGYAMVDPDNDIDSSLIGVFQSSRNLSGDAHQ